MNSDEQQVADAAWYERCHVCGTVDHFRELEYNPETGQWMCVPCSPKFNPNDADCLEAVKVEDDVSRLEAIWLLEALPARA